MSHSCFIDILADGKPERDDCEDDKHVGNGYKMRDTILVSGWQWLEQHAS